MKKTILNATAALLITASATTHATLEPRLSGMAYYDTNTGLTWAAPEFIASPRTVIDQIDFLSNLSMGGIGGWRLPDVYEFTNFIFTNSDCVSVPTLCLPIPPLDSDPGILAKFYGSGSRVYIDSLSGHEYLLYGDVIRPWTREWYPGDVWINSAFPSWPVHTGDVPLVAAPVPEPSTYAMLLAGLGLMGFSLKRQTKSSLFNA